MAIEQNLRRQVREGWNRQPNYFSADTPHIVEADASFAPVDAEYIVGALSSALTNERVVTNTSTITWDLGTAGQAKANLAVTLVSGTYTPTWTTVANCSGVSASVCQYLRVGETVTVSGQVTFTITAAATLTQIDMSVPVASNFSATTQSGGILGGNDGTILVGATDASNDRITFIANNPLSSGSIAFSFTVSYQVI